MTILNKNNILKQYGVSAWGLVIIGVLILTWLQTASADSTPPDWSNTTRILYQYEGGTVAPQYHRSYEIDVTQSIVKVTVDSYHVILAQKSYDITQQKFEWLVASLSRNNIRNVSHQYQSLTIGGPRQKIEVYNQQGVFFYGTNNLSPQNDWGNLDGNVDAFVNDLKALVPDLSELLRIKGPNSGS
jgi:hypothetical protein